MSFELPQNYSVPSSGGKYMKFQQGDNIFRIMASPILGWEGWKDRKPVRFPYDKKPTDLREFDRQEVKHFWAMPVWNEGKIKILEITQVGIQQALTDLAHDEDWGDPTGYDIKVVRTGEGMETSYSVAPKPHRETPQEARDALKEANLNLEALFEGGDPWGGEKDTQTDEEPPLESYEESVPF